MTVIRVITLFLSPVGINRLLAYLESGGKDAVVRPWVWVSWLFFGPVIGTIAFQWYIFQTTATLVRAEGIITQLIFEHALRIRMKAQSSSDNPPGVPASTTNSSSAQTPDTASVADSETQTEGTTLVNGNGDQHSVKSTSSKGKAKSVTPSQSEDASKPESRSGTDNLVGKLNNLVTTDLSNITEGRDFLLLVVQGPLLVGFGIYFLYNILGWKWAISYISCSNV